MVRNSLKRVHSREVETFVHFFLSFVAISFNRHHMVRTVLIKVEVQRKDNMWCTRDRNASGSVKNVRLDADHIEYKMLFVHRRHFSDLI